MEMNHPLAEGEPIRLISSPIKMSETPVSYRYPPPTLGQHTDEILSDVLGLNEAIRNKLRTDGII
jgi:crotonobetainyl-CoA:carnitine CoA-transferase CaiB-like acyl-CoA transferase